MIARHRIFSESRSDLLHQVMDFPIPRHIPIHDITGSDENIGFFGTNQVNNPLEVFLPVNESQVHIRDLSDF